MLKSSGKKVTLQTESKLVSLKEECKLLAGSLTTKRVRPLKNLLHLWFFNCFEVDISYIWSEMVSYYFWKIKKKSLIRMICYYKNI